MASLLAALALLTGTSWADDGHVEGILFDELTGRPVAGVTVAAGDASDVTDPDGYFQLALDPGTWTVRLATQSHRAGDVPDVLVVDGEWTELLVTLSTGAAPRARIQAPLEREAVTVDTSIPLAEVRGIVTSADTREPIAGARLYVRGTAAEAVTGEDGTYTMQVPIGLHAISVLRNGYSTQTLSDVALDESGLALPIALSPRGVALDDFVVTAPYIEGSTASLLDERRLSCECPRPPAPSRSRWRALAARIGTAHLPAAELRDRVAVAPAP